VNLLIFFLLDVSKCWDEFNFVRTAGLEYAPIIFHDFIKENSDDFLVYSHDLRIVFEPEKIGVTSEGFLFQKIELNDLRYGLFSSELSVKLYEKFEVILHFFIFEYAIFFINFICKFWFFKKRIQSFF